MPCRSCDSHKNKSCAVPQAMQYCVNVGAMSDALSISIIPVHRGGVLFHQRHQANIKTFPAKSSKKSISLSLFCCSGAMRGPRHCIVQYFEK